MGDGHHHITTQEGWLYLAGVKDVFTCELVGYAMGKRMTQALTLQALFRAVGQNSEELVGVSQLVYHSWCITVGVSQLVYHQRYATRAQAITSIREYIEIFYNRQRRHSRLGYLAPAVFAQTFSKERHVA